MTITSRLTPAILSILMLSGCISTATAISDTHRLVSADPIDTQFVVAIRSPENSSQTKDVLLTPATSAGSGYEKLYLGYVLMDSGMKCQAFMDRLSTAQRSVDTSFDILSGILSALATALTPLSTVHALTAGATISTGTKSAIAADVYAKATASLILQQINNSYYARIDDYREKLSSMDDRIVVPTLEVSHIEEIHRLCSLDSAIGLLSQAGAAANASLGAAAGAAKGASEAQAKNLSPTEGAILGAAAGAAAAASGPAAAPADVAMQGAAAAATALTPPATSPPPASPIAPPAPEANPTPPSSPRRPPPPGPACQASGPTILVACPQLPPEVQSARKQLHDEVRRLSDAAKLHAVAQALGVATPVPTVICMRSDIFRRIEQICTADQLAETNRALADLNLNKK